MMRRRTVVTSVIALGFSLSGQALAQGAPKPAPAPAKPAPAPANSINTVSETGLKNPFVIVLILVLFLKVNNYVIYGKTIAECYGAELITYIFQLFVFFLFG